MSKISIVLPVYNGELHIKESIDSIINQTFVDWELIIVNDCSTDKTLDIITDYMKRDMRIRIVNNDNNLKLPKSLNKGFEYAQGEYLTWTSDDNIYLENALECMHNFLEKNIEASMVCADMETIDTNGKVIGKEPVFNNDELACRNRVGACFLYRKIILKDIGKYDETLFLVEDYDYWMRIQEKYGEIFRISKVLYKYRRHEKSLSLSKQKQVIQSLISLREKHCKYIFYKLENLPHLLYYIFIENLINNNTESKMNEIIYKHLPEVTPILQNTSRNKKIIVFGAGNYGRKFYKESKSEVVAFVDNNQNIIGKSIDGIRIKSLEEITDKEGDFHIVVAMSKEKQYEVILQLWNAGFKNYSILLY